MNNSKSALNYMQFWSSTVKKNSAGCSGLCQ
jgi:hypothetical protein